MRRWRCLCDCGNERVVQGSNLRRGLTQSCGCLGSELSREANTTHGLTAHPLFSVWKGMHQRCSNPNNKSYAYYGGAGIKVCRAWSTFKPFYEWSMANDWSLGLTIDRIRVRGDYRPSNCRWATRAVQARNARSNIRVVVDNETITLAEAARKFGVTFWKARRVWEISQAAKISFQRTLTAVVSSG